MDRSLIVQFAVCMVLILLFAGCVGLFFACLIHLALIQGRCL